MRTEMERVEDVMEYPTDVNYENEQEEENEDKEAEYGKLSGTVEMKNVTLAIPVSASR